MSCLVKAPFDVRNRDTWKARARGRRQRLRRGCLFVKAPFDAWKHGPWEGEGGGGASDRESCSLRCRAIMAHDTRSRPDSGLKDKVIKTISVFPLGSEAAGNTRVLPQSPLGCHEARELHLRGREEEREIERESERAR